MHDTESLMALAHSCANDYFENYSDYFDEEQLPLLAEDWEKFQALVGEDYDDADREAFIDAYLSMLEELAEEDAAETAEFMDWIHDYEDEIREDRPEFHLEDDDDDYWGDEDDDEDFDDFDD